MKTLLTILAIIPLLYCIAWQMTTWQYRNFHRNLKLGDKVDYISDKRRTYKLERVYSKWCEIRNKNGTLRKVKIVDLLPHFLFNYK